MAQLVLILGQSGSGKSTSIKSLNPEETTIVNVLEKVLPFKGSKSKYNYENKHLVHKDKAADVISYLQNISKNAPTIKNIVIDDAIYVMRQEFFARKYERGFDKFNLLADNFKRIIECCNSLRDDLNVFMMMHIEPVENEGTIIGWKCSTVGKLLDKLFNPLESVSIALFCDPKFDDKGNPEFGFWTKMRRVKGIELPCKAPDGMFEEEFIPNDLQLVANKIKEYLE